MIINDCISILAVVYSGTKNYYRAVLLLCPGFDLMSASMFVLLCTNKVLYTSMYKI